MENGRIDYGTNGTDLTSKSSNQTTSMILFGGSFDGNSPTPISAYNMKVYRLKLYENDVLVREYVPCYRVSDNEIGLYELVNNVFYPNNGTGAFNKGNDIETSGTMSNQHFVYNIAQNLKKNKFLRKGYKFNGWNTKIDGTGTAYTNKQNVNNLTTVDNTTINLYSQWVYIGDSASGDNEITNKNIIDYDVDLGIDVDGNSQYDWQYFYNDGDNIYIIAEDYIPMNSSLLSSSLGNKKEDIASHPYSFFYDMSENDGNTIINNGKTGSADLFGNNVSDSNKFIPDRYLVRWKEKVKNSPTTANNAKIVASMMDTTLWENFANSTKIKNVIGTSKPEELLATGGPTLEMWIKSWNERHGSSSNDENKIQIEYACMEDELGYEVRAQGGEWDYSIDLTSNSDGMEDIMYLPHDSEYNQCAGYWIISPSASGANSIMRIGYNGVVRGDGCGNWFFGIRPVVCLPSDITAEWDDNDEIWKIKKKTEYVEYLTDNDYLIVMASSKSKFEGKTNVGTIEEFRTLVNSGNFNYQKAYLYEDIDLEGSASNVWTPIGTSTNKFSKVLDGRNHSVNDIYSNSSNQGQALFSYNTGTIQNLTVNGIINCTANGVAGIVAQNEGTVENCISNVTITGKEYVGGIVGYSTSTSTILNCTSTGNVEGEQIVGGIAGGCDGNITGCSNYGNIKSTSDSSSTISTGLCGTGGITGAEYLGTVSNCRNLGYVEGKSTCVGGIAGTNYSANIKNCYNDGEIYSEKGGTGGIAGLQKGNSSTKYCYNKNKVTSHSNIGGIIGDLNTGSVENCYNIGQVETYQLATVINMGGICGRSRSGTNVKNCYTLDSLNLEAVGLPEENTVDSLTKKESEQNMKASSFVETLNSNESNYKVDYQGTNAVNNGYPILSWQ